MTLRPLTVALVVTAAVLLAGGAAAPAVADNCESLPAEQQPAETTSAAVADESPDVCGGPPAPQPPPEDPPPPGEPAPPPPENHPFGWLDGIDGEGVASGWACDADDFGLGLVIHFYADGPAGSGTFAGWTVASEGREQAVGDLCGGNRFHGYAFLVPDSLRDNDAHTLYAYALNVGGGDNRLLSGSPKSFALLRPTPENPFPDGAYAEDDALEVADAAGNSTVGTCKTVQYRRTTRSMLARTVLWRMTLKLRWCWVGARIVETSAICFNSDVSSFIQANPCPPPQGQFYETAYDKRGGWHAVAQNAYSNCLPGPAYQWTCFYQWNPTLQIFARAGGAWSTKGS